MAGTYSNGYQYSSYNTTDTNAGMSGETKALSDVISTNVQKVSQSVASMQKMINQLGTPQDCESLRAQLHQVQQYTNQLVKDTNNHLKELSNLPPSPILSEERQRKVLKDKLTHQFSEALKNFQAQQRNAAQKERESVMRARAHSGLSGNPFGEDQQTSGHNLIELQSPTQTQMMTSLQMEEEVNLDLLREREEAVRKLEADIVDVNHIFTDLATLVHEQGEVIDSIEANVEQTTIHVSEGTQQLAKARRYQATKRKVCFTVIIVILIFAVLGLIIMLASK